LAERWAQPRGYIHVDSGNGCVVSVEMLDDILAPIVHMCPYNLMEHIPSSFITDGHVVILTNEEGNFFDAINIPVGWLLSVNGVSISIQTAPWRRMEHA